MKLAAIDIGSNSIKLVVVNAPSGDSFSVLARDKETVRLGHETLREGFLSPEAFERAARCVKRFRAVAEAHGAERVLAVATASVRAASNAAEFVEELARETGVGVKVISGDEEARLTGLAAARGCSDPPASLLNVDIGGGSTEISLMRGGAPVALVSVRLGAVGLTERFIADDPPKVRELRALRAVARATLKRPARELRDASWSRATGTSGTIIAIGEALRARDSKQKPGGTRTGGDGIVLSRLERFNKRMAGMTQAERRAVRGVSAQRSEIIVAGGQILEAVMRSLSINYLRTCDWALREGVVLDFLRATEAVPGPRPDADPRLVLHESG
ncbi:MAG TPA: Ppx/GppA phosphatase family protein [Pyrinomonadaceae bacterium]